MPKVGELVGVSKYLRPWLEDGGKPRLDMPEDRETPEWRLERVKAMPPVERFLYWICERERIRLKRVAGFLAPWTADPILQRYRFCNVRRMDDKVSQWLLKNWYEPNFDHPNMLIACTMARHFNTPESMCRIGFPFKYDPIKLKADLIGVAKTTNLFSGAYVVSSDGSKPKSSMIVDLILTPLHSNPPSLNLDSVEECVTTLMNRPRFGSFMAGQVIADMRWSAKGAWKDAKTWAPQGPGSVRGMNRLDSNPITNILLAAKFSHRLREVIALCTSTLPRRITSRLEAIDYQNCLCEFDKYERTLHGEGKPKQIYRGGK